MSLLRLIASGLTRRESANPKRLAIAGKPCSDTKQSDGV
jgi:hypothetical protein